VTRGVFVRRLVLNSICDFGENVDQCILHDVAEDGAKCGLTIDRAEILDALTGLIEDGLAKASLLSPWEPETEIQGMPPMDVIEECFKTFFFITEKGMEVHLSDGTWYPFDDDGNLRPDWHLDEVQP
jgi:hypothetical protein